MSLFGGRTAVVPSQSGAVGNSDWSSEIESLDS
jgi:hypothetical protein